MHEPSFIKFPEQAYGTYVYGEESQESRQEVYDSERRTTEKARKKKAKTTSSSPVGSTGKYSDYAVTPLHQVIILHAFL